MGQLQDAGNTTTLAHYLQLLDSAGLVGGIEKFSGNKIMQKLSSPKFQVHNTALISAQSPELFSEMIVQPEKWGRIVESAVGMHLLNQSRESNFELFYWREGNDEVDFVLKIRQKVIAIEVKSGSAGSTTGMSVFQKNFNPDKLLLVGSSGIPWEEFLKINPMDLLK